MPECRDAAPANDADEGKTPASPDDRRKQAVQATLPAPARHLHVRILRAFLRDGTPPAPATLASWVEDLGLPVIDAMATLADADLVHADPATGGIVTAYPFSGRPTDHVVQLQGFPPVYAMCAVDALGIPLMTGRDGDIVSRDPVTDTRVRVEARGGTWRWDPTTTMVVSAGTGQSGASHCCTCPFVTFHVDLESATQLLASSEVTGHILGQQEAIEAADKHFGRLLHAGDQ